MSDDGGNTERQLARRIQVRLIEELEAAYDDAAMQGLCGEGALEYALGRVRDMDPGTLLDNTDTTATDHSQGDD